MSASKQVYLQGETANIKIADKGYTAVSIQIGGTDAASVSAMTLADGYWTDSLDTTDLSGGFRYAILADGKLVEEGEFAVRVLVSKYRKVVQAIDAAMKKAGMSGVSSVSVGEINLTNKSFDEMQRWRDYYQSMAIAEERGEMPSDSASPIREDMWL